MLHCQKEKKSDGSRYNVLLFFSLVICKKVLFLFTKKNWDKIFLNELNYFFGYKSKIEVKVVSVNFAEYRKNRKKYIFFPLISYISHCLRIKN